MFPVTSSCILNNNYTVILSLHFNFVKQNTFPSVEQRLQNFLNSLLFKTYVASL